MDLYKLYKLLVKTNKKRPFVAYIHGTDNDEFVQSLIEKQCDMKIFGRNNVFSTFVNCGTPKTDIASRIIDYEYAGRNFNVVMVMPDELAIPNYCGCVEGQNKTQQGYSNQTEIDYQVLGFNYFMENKEVLDKTKLKDFSRQLDHINNKLILGYFNKETFEFTLNKNCILFEKEKDYKKIIENSFLNTNLIYYKYIKNKLEKQLFLPDYARNLESFETETVENILSSNENFNSFLNFCVHNYSKSDECAFDKDIENLNFRNNVKFKSNVLNSFYKLIELGHANNSENE